MKAAGRKKVLSFTTIVALIATVLAVYPGVTPASATPLLDVNEVERTDGGALEVGGDPLVWTGPFLERAAVMWELCGIQGPCFRYDIEVPEGGSRLKVLIDVPDLSDHWALGLVTPQGRNLPLVYDPTSDSRAEITRQRWTFEWTRNDPAPGTWQAVVVPINVTDANFRVRAILDGDRDNGIGNDVGHGHHKLLPNLRAFPIIEPTFAAPARQIHVGGTPNPPLSAAGQHPVSCTADETADKKNAAKCLRFTSGTENVGLGPLQLKFDSSNLTDKTRLMRQVIHLSNGSTYERDAGTYRYHETHGHYHYDDMGVSDLLKVTYEEDLSATLTEVGQGKKQGFCLLDTLIVDIHSRDSDPQQIRRSECDLGGAGIMSLNRGWTDVYGWYIPGQYVEFGDNGDGEYILRFTVDKAGTIEETNENDNVAYTWIDVQGKCIQILERGRGTSPWDPQKEVVDSSFYLNAWTPNC